MNHKFDELTKNMAQSVTRRAALKRFGIGLAGMALAGLGLANKSEAATHSGFCGIANGFDRFVFTGYCWDATTCQQVASSQCKGNVKSKNVAFSPCGTRVDTSKPCSY